MRNGESITRCSSAPLRARCGLGLGWGVKHALAARQRGFTYIGLLIAVLIIGGTLAQAGTIWHVAQQREKERELIFVGNQIRQAIGRYYNTGAGTARQYPQSLDDLLRDPRHPGIVRHLRKLYYDPITGTIEWGLVKNAEGRITGIYSTSEQLPIKQSNFSPIDVDFEGKEKYSQWAFVFQPKQANLNKNRKPYAQADTRP
jgi:type II secretory pathway pseudopilin PulG